MMAWLYWQTGDEPLARRTPTRSSAAVLRRSYETLLWALRYSNPHPPLGGRDTELGVGERRQPHKNVAYSKMMV